MGYSSVYVSGFDLRSGIEDALLEHFRGYGQVDGLDMKRGFCFLQVPEDEIEKVLEADNRSFEGRSLRVEKTRSTGETYRREQERKKEVQKPTKTLFITKFDVVDTRESDIKKKFSEFGEIKEIDVKSTYAFVTYENQEDAEKACNAMDGGEMNGKTLVVEYSTKSSTGPRGGGYRGGRGGPSYHGNDRYTPYRRDSYRRSPPRRSYDDYGRRDSDRYGDRYGDRQDDRYGDKYNDRYDDRYGRNDRYDRRSPPRRSPPRRDYRDYSPRRERYGGADRGGDRFSDRY